MVASSEQSEEITARACAKEVYVQKKGYQVYFQAKKMNCLRRATILITSSNCQISGNVPLYRILSLVDHS
jgi:hypothetical protein